MYRSSFSFYTPLMVKKNTQRRAYNTMASRIRYARESQGVGPQALRAELKKRRIDVSKQLLHRYESVESQNPNLMMTLRFGTDSPNRKVITGLFNAVCEPDVHDTADCSTAARKITSLQINEAQKNPDGIIRPGF